MTDYCPRCQTQRSLLEQIVDERDAAISRAEAAEAELESIRQSHPMVTIRKLQAEVERLSKDRDETCDLLADEIKQNDSLRVEVARLKGIENTLQNLYNAERVATNEAWTENESLQAEVARLKREVAMERDRIVSLLIYEGTDSVCTEPEIHHDLKIVSMGFDEGKLRRLINGQD